MIIEQLRVVIYVRVSTQEQATEGYSIGEQIERLNKYCEAMGWVIVKTYVDPGYSGGNTDRPGLQELIKEVESGNVDKVVVYKLDRLSRSQLDTLYLIEKVFLANNADFVSMSENFDTSTPFGRAMIGILAVFAQLEREQIKERMNMGKEARAKSGKWVGGSTQPIGYNYNPVTELLEVNEFEAMQVRELFRLFLKGTPVNTIVKQFHEKGFNHKHGNWDCKSARRILASKTALGYIKFRDNYYKAEHEPIIDEDTFNRAQELLADRAEYYKQFYRKPGTRTTYLSGLLYCRHCSARYAKNTGSKKHNLKYYCCYSRSNKVKAMVKDPNCKNKNWRMEVLDEIVLGEIKKLALDKDYLNQLIENKPADATPDSIRIIETEIEQINEQISRYMDLYSLKAFSLTEVDEKVKPLDKRRTALQKELAELNNERGMITEEKAHELIDSFEDVLEAGDFDEIRLVIDSLIHRIEVDEEDVYIYWRFA